MEKLTLEKIEELATEFKDMKTSEYEDLTLEVKQYLPIQEKIDLVKDVVLRSMVENDGIQIIHSYMSHISKTTSIIRSYTNIELPEDNFEAYDLLNRLNMYKSALSMIPESELKEIDMMISKFAEDLRFNQMYSNSVETVIKQALDKLIKMIPDEKKMKKLTKELQKSLDGLDPKKLKMIGQALGWNNGVDISGGSKDI